MQSLLYTNKIQKCTYKHWCVHKKLLDSRSDGDGKRKTGVDKDLQTASVMSPLIFPTRILQDHR